MPHNYRYEELCALGDGTTQYYDHDDDCVVNLPGRLSVYTPRRQPSRGVKVQRSEDNGNGKVEVKLEQEEETVVAAPKRRSRVKSEAPLTPKSTGRSSNSVTMVTRSATKRKIDEISNDDWVTTFGVTSDEANLRMLADIAALVSAFPHLPTNKECVLEIKKIYGL